MSKILKKGFITKEGSNVKSWKKRWFIFQSDGNMSYYTNERDLVKKGEVDMRRAYQLKKVEGKKECLEIHFDTTRVLRLKFDDSDDEKEWMNVLLDYIEDNKHMVTGFSKYEKPQYEDFQIGAMHYQTSRGTVHSVFHLRTQIKYVMKTINIKSIRSEELNHLKNIHNELSRNTCNYLSRTFASFETDRIHFIMSEQTTNTLEEVMITSVLPLQRVKLYAAELLLALNTLKLCKYIHNEINPETVVLSKDGHILLTTPIGLNKQYKSGIHYTAPEVISQQTQITHAADYWSYAVLLYHMIFGSSPFNNNDMNVVLSNIRNVVYSFPPDCEKEVKEYIEVLLKFNPEERLTDFVSLKKKDFFASIDFAKL